MTINDVTSESRERSLFCLFYYMRSTVMYTKVALKPCASPYVQHPNFTKDSHAHGPMGNLPSIRGRISAKGNTWAPINKYNNGFMIRRVFFFSRI
jgi:hypothetical protein